MPATALDPFRIVVLAAVAVTLVVAAVGWLRARRARPVVFPPASPRCAERPAAGTRSAEVAALFGGLGPGTRLDAWRIVELYEDDRGCVPVVLAAPGGEPFRIDVLRREAGGPPPPAQTDRLALYLAGIRAGSPTPEDCLRGAAALASALASVAAEPPPWLLTLRERAELLRAPRPP
jgi:hypothetical protein